MNDEMTSYTQVAIMFAKALVDGDFEIAQSLLVPEMRRRFSPEILREHLHSMYSGYTEGTPKRIIFDEQFAMTDWPDKQPGDSGWAYVSIEGDDFVEAVAVVVTDLEGELLIREIEWGRP